MLIFHLRISLFFCDQNFCHPALLTKLYNLQLSFGSGLWLTEPNPDPIESWWQNWAEPSCSVQIQIGDNRLKEKNTRIPLYNQPFCRLGFVPDASWRFTNSFSPVLFTYLKRKTLVCHRSKKCYFCTNYLHRRNTFLFFARASIVW